jgi:hypothetical protein
MSSLPAQLLVADLLVVAGGTLKMLWKAPEPPSAGSRRLPTNINPINHLRPPDGRPFILPS